MICRKMRCLRLQQRACGHSLRRSLRGLADSGARVAPPMSFAAVSGGICVRRLETCRRTFVVLDCGSCCSRALRVNRVSFGPRLACKVHALRTARAARVDVELEKPLPLTASGRFCVSDGVRGLIDRFSNDCVSEHERFASRAFHSRPQVGSDAFERPAALGDGDAGVANEHRVDPS